MSFILDALKRTASEPQAGQAPDLLQPQLSLVSTTPKRGIMPWVALILIVAAGALLVVLQPWQSQDVGVQPVAPVAVDVQVLGDVDYSQYSPRARVKPVVVAPAANPSVTLPQAPISQVTLEGEDPIEQANQAAKTEEEPNDKLTGDQLKALFEQAVAETKPAPAENLNRYAQVPPLAVKDPAFQQLVPPLNFNAHSFASDPAKRLIKVNGQELREGEWINDDLQVLAIMPDKVILQLQGEMFSLPALADW